MGRLSDLSPFFQLHSGLPREGPGEAADVVWTAQVAGLAPNSAICDVACGPGADIAALRAAAPQGFVTGIDRQAHFVAAAAAMHSGDVRVAIRQADMARLEGRFDLIWCAGALYILGLSKGLRLWREHLKPDGVIAFSQPCYFTRSRGPEARALWEGEGEVLGKLGLATQIGLAGYEVLATRQLSDAAWEAYYTPMEARISQLRPRANAALTSVLDQTAEEIRLWRAARAETGYLLCVVRPV